MMSVLQGLFIGLKLTGAIDWSWWLVLLPFILHILAAALAALVEVLDDSLR